jgi:hypothetical protein
MDDFIVGRKDIIRLKGTKEIVPFMRHFIKLHADHDQAWRTVKRWKDQYGLPIEYAANDEPYMIQEVFFAWWGSSKANVSKRSVRKEIQQNPADSQ